MSRPRFERRQADSPDPTVVGHLARAVGLVVVAATVPVLVGLAAGFFADAGTLGAAAGAVVSAMTGSLGQQTGSVWLFHAAGLGLAGGCWLVGAGLVVDGVFD